MAATDQQIKVLGTSAVPASWPLPASLELVPKAVFASFDGSAAAGSFLPTLTILSDSGDVIGRFDADTAVAAGDSADASFAPFLKSSVAAVSASGIADAYAHLRYDPTFLPNPQTCNGTTVRGIFWNRFYTDDQTVFRTGGDPLFGPFNTPGNVRLCTQKAGFYACMLRVVFDTTVNGKDAWASFLQDTELSLDRDYNSVSAQGILRSAVAPSFTAPTVTDFALYRVGDDTLFRGMTAQAFVSGGSAVAIVSATFACLYFGESVAQVQRPSPIY